MAEQLIKKNRDVRDPRNLEMKFVNNPLIRNPQLNVLQVEAKVKFKFNVQILLEGKQNKCQFLPCLNYLNLLIIINNLFTFMAKKVPIFCLMAIKCPLFNRSSDGPLHRYPWLFSPNSRFTYSKILAMVGPA